MRHFQKKQKDIKLKIGVILTVLLILTSLTSLFYLPFDPDKIDRTNAYAPPSKTHWFGTDRFGRDIFSRCMVGARVAIYVGLVATIIGCLGGASLGLWAGYAGGLVERVIMRVMDALFAFPPLIFALMIVAVLGTGIEKTIMAIGVVNIPVFARITRAKVEAEMKKEYILAAYALGAKHWRLAFVHLLRNVTGPIIVQCSITFGLAILSEAGLSYLGLGVQAPQASWGGMLKEAQLIVLQAPWNAIFPGLCIVWAVMGLNLLSDGLNDKLNM